MTAIAPAPPEELEPSFKSACVYEVQPSQDLPVLDLSVTLKSRFLSPSSRRHFDNCMRRRELILVAYSCTVLLYFVALIIAPQTGEVLSVVGMLLGTPGTLFVLSALRYDTLRILLPTYDVVFFDTIVVSTLVVLMMMLHDARICIVLQALIAYQINIVVDANIQAVRRVAIVNVFAMMMSAFVGLSTAFDLIPDLKHFTLLAYGSHTLQARSFVTDGFLTILAIMARNIYRKKAVLINRSTGAVIECVSYRCHLVIRQLHRPSLDRRCGPTSPTAKHTSACGPQASHIQAMRYVARLPLIDAERVVLPQIFIWLTQPRRARVKRIAFQILGLTSASLALGAGVYEFTRFKLHQHKPSTPTGAHTQEHPAHITILVAAVLTFVYVALCATLYQRELLSAIITSFDFVFLSTQITFVHFATADFFHWNSHCLWLVTTWLWSHWVFCVDALTPVVRDRIGLLSVFTKVVMAVLVMSTGILNHLLLFSDGYITINDRVMWSGSVLGRRFEFRLLSTFYSTYVTVMAWALRLLWRVIFAGGDEFVLLDGAVAFDNYLRQPNKSLKNHLLMLRASAVNVLNGSRRAVHAEPMTSLILPTQPPSSPQK